MPHYFPRSLLVLALSLSFFVATPGAQAASEDDDIPASVANAEALPADDASSVEELGVPSDVWERIRRGYAMPVLQSKLVDRWVDFYTKDPAYLRRMSERAGQYLYHIVEEIENRGMPTELALLPFVESAFQAEALSRAKAAGLWQFMPATGKAYDLAQNLWRDDRRGTRLFRISARNVRGLAFGPCRLQLGRRECSACNSAREAPQTADRLPSPENASGNGKLRAKTRGCEAHHLESFQIRHHVARRGERTFLRDDHEAPRHRH